jgi:HSP20 family protein
MAADEKTTRETRPTARASGNPMVDLRREMDHLFDEFANAFRFPTFGFGRPAAGDGGIEMTDVRFDVSETPEAIEITAEVPGLSEDDIDIDMTNDVLTIKGEKKAESEKKEKNYYLSERRYGRFQRSFRVPDSVDRDNVDAAFDKGVLTVTLPKRAEAKSDTRKIDVKSR